MKLSPHFTYQEMIRSATADELGIDNTPPKEALEWLTILCNTILEPVRVHYGVPITPSSGYRCHALNKAVGGSPTSQHIKGQAVDFKVRGVSLYDLAVYIRDNLEFDQLILEPGWVHVSVSSKPRGEVLTKGPKLYAIGLPDKCLDTGFVNELTS